MERPVPLSATHTGLVGPKAMPHEFTRFGSTVAAHPGTSEIKLVCVTLWALARVDRPAATRAKANSVVLALFGIHHDIKILLGIIVANANHVLASILGQ